MADNKKYYWLKLKDDFSEKELLEIAEKLNVKYEGYFFLDNGTKI